MGSILDVVGSFIIGTLLLMMILRVNGEYNQNTTQDRLDLIAQENLSILVEEIEYDFRKIGHGVNNPANAITAADTSSITFSADLDNNGTLEVVRYLLSGTDQATATDNPNDRILFRFEDGTPVGGTLGVVDFQITLRDVTGAQTSILSQVKTVEYYLLVESPFAIDSSYSQCTWSGAVSPINIQ